MCVGVCTSHFFLDRGYRSRRHRSRALWTPSQTASETINSTSEFGKVWSVGTCVIEREREIFVCVRVCVKLRRQIQKSSMWWYRCMCVCERMWENEREGERMCVHVWERLCERTREERDCVCVRVQESCPACVGPPTTIAYRD